MGGGGKNTVVAEDKILGLRVQSSVAGNPIPILWGQTRIPGNLIWYADFTATAHSSTTSAGGKGGGGGTQTNVSYTYTAAIMMALCEGPIDDVPVVWAGKNKVSSLVPFSFGLFHGGPLQDQWTYLTDRHPDQELWYRNQAMVVSTAYDLGTSGSLPNHNFEIAGRARYDPDNGIPDALPADILEEFLTNAQFGVGVPDFIIGDWSDWTDFCIASLIFLSPALVAPEAASEFVKRLMTLTNSEIFYSENILKIVPYADEAVSSSLGTYTPNMTPVYNLTDSDFLAGDGEDPIKCTRTDQADAFNQLQVLFPDRNNDYNETAVEFKDQANIELYGLRPAEPLKALEVPLITSAQSIADFIGRRNLYIRNTYEFRVGWKYARLEPMDVISITDTGLGLNQALVRVKEVKEDDNGTLLITAEEIPGHANTSTTYDQQTPNGYAANYNVDPGDVDAVTFIEAPAVLTTAGLELWLAISGSNENWGGSEVWCSFDGNSYKRVGSVFGRSRHGVLTANLPNGNDPDTDNTLSVDLTISDGELISGSRQDADLLNTLCYVDGEFIAYQDATLTAANKYNLTYLRRGQFHIDSASHLTGSRFARLDDAIFKFPYTSDLIGSTIQIKFLSFNIYGQAIQELENVNVFSYTLRGTALLSDIADITGLSTRYVSGITQLFWNALADFRTVDYEVRLGSTWDSAIVLGRVPTPYFTSQGDGTYWVAGHYLSPDGLDIYSANPQDVVITGSLLTTNVVATNNEGPSWSGTFTPYAVKSGNNVVLDSIGNWLGISDFLNELDILHFGGIGSSGIYQIPASHQVNVGRVVACGILMSFTLRGQSLNDNWLSYTDFLNVTDLLGASLGRSVSAIPQIRTAQADAVYGDWQNYIPGDYSAQYFDARILLFSTDTQIYPLLEQFAFTVDMPDRVDTGTDVTIASGGSNITFFTPFNGGPDLSTAPNIQITLINATAGDDVVLTNQTLSGFTVQVKNSGNGVSRHINWRADGF